MQHILVSTVLKTALVLWTTHKTVMMQQDFVPANLDGMGPNVIEVNERNMALTLMTVTLKPRTLSNLESY
jgi:hypothetical protein